MASARKKETALLLENIHEDAAKALAKAGYTVVRLPKALDEDELIKALKGCTLLGIRSKTHVTQRVFENAPQLLAVGAFCIGTNQIDLKAASEHGVAVFNAPFSNTRSVVELVLAEMVMLLRKATDKSAKLHKGEWDKSAEGCFEARGKTLGIVGYGNIGSQLSVLAESLGMRVIFYDVAEKLALGMASRARSLDELLRTADVVTLHVDGGNDRLFNAKEFARMKKGSYFINLSRGHLVDVDALASALKKGHFAGAAVDVFPDEPRSNAERFVSPLQGIPNVILTPHVGGSTEEAQEDIARHVSDRLRAYRDTGTTALSVNMPAIRNGKWEKTHRIAHIHRNVPGILAAITKVLSARNINILGQYLNTNQSLGYCVIDFAAPKVDEVLKELKKIPGTIRARIVY
jgi:D-3-phosphoglycerate dehydrogenase